MRSVLLVTIVNVMSACKGADAGLEPWQRESQQFMTKLVDAIDREPKNCGKLAAELAKLEPDARALYATLEKAGKHLHDFQASDDVKARFFAREPNPLAYCSGNQQFDVALAHSYSFAETGKVD
jgi:hypothetical protein